MMTFNGLKVDEKDLLPALLQFARMEALDVLQPDEPEVVRRFLETGDPALASAAWDAASSDAARAAAMAAAREVAAEKAARKAKKCEAIDAVTPARWASSDAARATADAAAYAWDAAEAARMADPSKTKTSQAARLLKMIAEAESAEAKAWVAEWEEWKTANEKMEAK